MGWMAVRSGFLPLDWWLDTLHLCHDLQPGFLNPVIL